MCNISSNLDAAVEPEDQNINVFLVFASRCLQHRDVESACRAVAMLTSEAARLRYPVKISKGNVCVFGMTWSWRRTKLSQGLDLSTCVGSFVL